MMTWAELMGEPPRETQPEVIDLQGFTLLWSYGIIDTVNTTPRPNEGTRP